MGEVPTRQGRGEAGGLGTTRQGWTSDLSRAPSGSGGVPTGLGCGVGWGASLSVCLSVRPFWVVCHSCTQSGVHEANKPPGKPPAEQVLHTRPPPMTGLLPTFQSLPVSAGSIHPDFLAVLRGTHGEK